MQNELTIGDLDTPVDAAGTLDVSRVNSTMVATIIKAATDVIVSIVNHNSPTSV